MIPPQLQRTIADAQEQLEQYRQQLRADQRNAFKKSALIACACAACLLAGIALTGATGLETTASS